MKSPVYVALSHLKEGLGPRRLLDVIRRGESTEVLAHFPEWKEEFAAVQVRYEAYVSMVEKTWAETPPIADQKEFAMRVKHLPYAGLLFAKRAGKIKSFREALIEQPIDKLERAIGLEPAAETAGAAE